MLSLSARSKLVSLLAMLIAISIASAPWLALCAVLCAISALALRLSLAKLLKQAAIVLPFSSVLALSVWWSGDGPLALLLLARSYTSVLAVVIFSAATPVWQWAAALEGWGVPSTLVMTLQFVHRYLVVIGEEAHRMRIAARARGGFRFDAAIGALGVLFARSWRRSEAIHRAMLARGFRGHFS